MITKIPSDPQEIKGLLDEINLPGTVYNGLEIGCGKVHEYFTGMDRPINKPLGASMARYHALCHVVEAFASNHFLLESVSNNGIAFRSPWCRIKTLKMCDDTPPAASSSLKSHLFFRQNAPEQTSSEQAKLFEDNGEPWHRGDWNFFIENAAFVNLILCWKVDAQYNLRNLQLMCPCDDGTYRKGTKLFWNPLVIPHPVTKVVPASTLNDSVVEDLPVYFEDAEEIFGND